MTLLNSRHLLIASIAATLVVAGCKSDEPAVDEDGQVVIDGTDATMESASKAAKDLVDADMDMVAVDMPMGDADAFASTKDGAVVYQTPGYAEVKSSDGMRLLVVDPTDADLDEVAEKGRISGEDFKLIGSKSPITGVSVLGENELKEAFYTRWGLDME